MYQYYFFQIDIPRMMSAFSRTFPYQENNILATIFSFPFGINLIKNLNKIKVTKETLVTVHIQTLEGCNRPSIYLFIVPGLTGGLLFITS